MELRELADDTLATRSGAVLNTVIARVTGRAGCGGVLGAELAAGALEARCLVQLRLEGARWTWCARSDTSTE